MNTGADYIALGKRCLPKDEKLTDEGLGLHLAKYNGGVPFAQPTIAKCKRAMMSDSVATALGLMLVKHGVIEHAGEVVLIAHAERDANPKVRAVLSDFAKKVLSPAVRKASGGVGTLVVALGMLFAPTHEAWAFGGAGGFRPRRGAA